MNQNETIARRVQQFDTKHGDDGIAINGWLIFSDGARREAHNLHGPLMEPPKDQQELEKIKLQYQEELLRRATENVQRKKQTIVQQTLPKTAAELAREFDKKHSKDGPGIREGGFIIYPDGAYRDFNTLGVLADAVPDPWNPLLLEKRVIRYWELALKLATDQFNELRNTWLMRAKGNLRETVVQGPPEITTAAIRRLKKLKTAVQEAQTKLDEARKQLEDAKPQWMRERHETSSMYRGVNEEFVEKVSNIQI